MTEQDNKGVTVLSEDNGEISDAQRREINEAVSWLNNWIEKRHERGFMSDAEYEKAHKKLQNLIVATKDEAYDFAGGMRASGYFSITDDNEKITINRKEYPVDNVIHVSRNADNLGSRVVHEATHALRLEDSEKACTPEKVQSYYMDDKREIYARVMETRYNFNLDPQAKLSKENLRYLRETELGPEALAREKEQAERDREFDAMLRELTGETPLPEAQAEEKEEVSPVKPQTTALYACIALIGFNNANLFPIMFSQAILHLPEKKNEISGLMIMGIFGGAVFPLLMGFASDLFGSQNGAVAIMGLGVVYLLSVIRKVRDTTRSRNDQNG